MDKNTLKAAVLIISLTAAVYANSLGNSFVWDDHLVIVNNDFIKSWSNLPRIFSKDYITSRTDADLLGLRDIGSGESSWRPAVTVSYFIDYAAWKLNPFGYHLTNLLLHIFNSLLLYALILLITGNRGLSLLASLFFALHPVNSEAVDVISFREDLLAFLFFVSSLVFYIRSSTSAPAKKVINYVLSLISFSLALFSKESAAALPAIIVLYDYFFVCGRDWRKSARFKYRWAGYLVILFLYLVVWGVYFKGLFGLGDIVSGFYKRNTFSLLLAMSEAFTTYIRWLIFPVNIHTVLYKEYFSFLSVSKLIFSALFVAISFYCLFRPRVSKESRFAMLWFYAALLPVSNIFPLSMPVASRYLYIPCAGFCLLLAGILLKKRDLELKHAGARTFLSFSGCIIGIILIFYGMFTMIRSICWKNNVTFWTESAQNYPDQAFIRSNLGMALAEAGFLDRGIEECLTGVKLAPRDALNHVRLGMCYYANGDTNGAVQEFRTAIKLNPKLERAHAYLAACLKKLQSTGIAPR